MAKLKKLESIVEKILEDNKDARENDDILYLYVCEYFNEEAPLMPLRSFLKLREEMYCPIYESVSRAKRKICARRPEFKIENKV